jgi:hypothetical protein
LPNKRANANELASRRVGQPRVGVIARDDRDIFLIDAETMQRFGDPGGDRRRGKQRERNRM